MANTSTMPMQWKLEGFESLKPRSARLIALGIFLMVLGFFAITMSVVSTILTVFLLGVVALVGGLAQIYHGFSSKGWGGVFLSIALGLLYTVAGIVMITNPASSAISLTLFLGAFIAAGGLIRAVSSLFYRFPSWGWSFFSGLISIVLGVLILSQWPLAGLWIIGLFVGIDLVFIGSSLTAFAFAARSALKAAQASI